MDYADFRSFLDRATAQPGFELRNEQLLLYPDNNLLTRFTGVSAAFAATVVAGQELHTVVVAYGRKRRAQAPELSFWCGDRFLDRDMLDFQQGMSLCRAAVEDGGVAQDTASRMAAAVFTNHGTYPKSTRCDFWLGWREQRTMCAHVSHVLACLRDARPDFEDALKRRYDDARAYLAG